MTRFGSAILLWFLAWPSTGQAETRRLSLERARELALKQHPRIGAAAARIRQAEARLAEARSLYYPRVLAAAEYLRGTSNNSPTTVLSVPNLPRIGGPTRDPRLESFDNAFLGVTSDLTLYDFGATHAVVEEGKARAAVAQAALRASQADVVLTVAEAYIAVLASRGTLAVVEEALERARKHRELVQAGVTSGLRGRIELARADAEVASIRVARIRAEGAATLARQALADAIGSGNDEVDATTDPIVPELTVRAEAALDDARRRRPEIDLVRAELRALEAQRDAAHATYYPRLFATGALSTRGQLTPDVYNWDVGAVLAWPIFTGGSTEHQVQAAEARIAEVSEHLRLLEQDISFEVRRALSGIAVARETIVAGQAQVDAARVALELAEGRYQKGLGNIIELADAEAGRSAAELGLIQGRYELARAGALLEHARGQ